MSSRIGWPGVPAQLAHEAGFCRPVRPDLLRPGLVVEENDAVDEFLERVKVVGRFGRDLFSLIKARQDGESEDRLHVGLLELVDDKRRDIDDAASEPATEQDGVDLQRIHSLDPGHHLLDIDHVRDPVGVFDTDPREEDPGGVRKVAELHEAVRVDIDGYRTHATDFASPVVIVEVIHNPGPGATQPYRQHSHGLLSLEWLLARKWARVPPGRY